MRIYKYPIPMTGKVELPLGARVLSTAAQEGIVYIWALIDPNVVGMEVRVFTIHPTGPDMSVSAHTGVYIGTVHLESGLVFHIFENKSPLEIT